MPVWKTKFYGFFIRLLEASRCLVMSAGFFMIVSSCVTSKDSSERLGINAQEASKLIPAGVKDANGWAADIVNSIEDIDMVPTPERVCAVVAVIEQESGYEADPKVKDLPAIVRTGLTKKFEKLGILADAAVAALLTGKGPGSTQTFEQRISKLRSERDLDVFFRDLAEAYKNKLPGTFLVASAISRIVGKGSLHNLNPVTTIGSMQVKLSYARELEAFQDLSDEELREHLYTRLGGIRAGVERLLGYKASYDDIVYRFADYNVGVYSSRNAAFQAQLAFLTSRQLVLDGDIMSYDEDGDLSDDPSKTFEAIEVFATRKEMSLWNARRAGRQEKTEKFEDTDLWNKVREDWEKKRGKKPAYAQIPQVTIHSPKLAGQRSTDWFATNVKKRYEACRQRIRAP